MTQKDIEYAIVEVWTTYRNKIDLIKKKIDNNLKDGKYKDDAKKEVFYKTLSYFLNKYGEDRLLKLAFQKRFNIFNKYNINQYQFSLLSFTTK